LRKSFAIKQTLFPDDGRHLNQFSEEAELLAHISHPALPRVSDHFREGNAAYLVMDYVPGESLGAFLRGQPDDYLDVTTALTLIEPVLDALTCQSGELLCNG
jgi:serine/threonine-protein kinase